MFTPSEDRSSFGNSRSDVQGEVSGVGQKGCMYMQRPEGHDDWCYSLLFFEALQHRTCLHRKSSDKICHVHWHLIDLRGVEPGALTALGGSDVFRNMVIAL